MTSKRRFWLMKTEPDLFSIDDLKRDRVSPWTGVRNYQARNFMRDGMKTGDLVLFYHSSCEPPGVAGLGRVARDGYPDFSAFDPKSESFDPKSKKESPTWIMVDVAFVEKFPRFVPLSDLQKHADLRGMVVTKRGSRLSVQPVEERHFDIVKKMGEGR